MYAYMYLYCLPVAAAVAFRLLQVDTPQAACYPGLAGSHSQLQAAWGRTREAGSPAAAAAEVVEREGVYGSGQCRRLLGTRVPVGKRHIQAAAVVLRVAAVLLQMEGKRLPRLVVVAVERHRPKNHQSVATEVVPSRLLLEFRAPRLQQIHVDAILAAQN